MPTDEMANLKNKVDDHDKSLMLMSKAVEDINKSLDRFVTSNEKLSTDMMKHWYIQDKTMDKLETILGKMSDGEARFRAIEDKQINGCPSFKNFMKNSDGEVKRWNTLADKILQSTDKNTVATDKLEQVTSVQSEKISVANKRISDIEKWQERAIIALIGNSLGVIGILISVIWNMVKH